jgi:hypothetical protein
VVLRAALRDRGYWLLAGVFVTQSGAVAVVSLHVVAYLRDAGHPARFAASVAGLLGVLSVAGRLVTTGARRRFRLEAVVAVVFAVQAAGALVLALAGTSTVGAVIGLIGFGIGFGVASVARPALLADRYGTTRYATISGVLTVLLAVVKAMAPLAASVLRVITGSYLAVMLAVSAACLVAAGVLAVGRRVLAEPAGQTAGQTADQVADPVVPATRAEPPVGGVRPG